MTTQINFLTDKLIILYYPAFAGGKFLSNCLALSRYAVSQNPKTSEVDLEINDITDITGITEYFLNLAINQYESIAGSEWPSLERLMSGEIPMGHIQNEMEHQFPFVLADIKRHYGYSKLLSYYDIKKNIVMQSLPHTKNAMHEWFSREFGCYQFFGQPNTIYTTLDQNQIELLKFNEVAVKASHSNKNFFLVAHERDGLMARLQAWPRATVLQLTNYKNFQKLAGPLKTKTRRDFSRRAPTISESDIKNRIIEFDVDANYFHKDKFLLAVEVLYAQLGYDDFNPELVGNFYEEYARLHGIIN